MERGQEGQVHRPHDPRVLERGPHRQGHRPRHVQDDQALPPAVHQAHPGSARPAGSSREEDLLPEPSEGRTSLLLQRV